MVADIWLLTCGCYLQCPELRERHGWLGDALDASEQALMNFDMAAIHEAYLQLIEDDQAGNGDVPVVVPDTASRDTPKATPGCNDIAWTAAFPLITKMQHTYYGNTRTLQQRWPSLVRCGRSSRILGQSSTRFASYS